MSKNYEITKELRSTLVEFLNAYGGYRECLEILENEGKENFTEDEVNQVLNLLGIFRLMDTFHIVERFKIEVTPLKSQESDEQSEPTSAQAE
jgi:hypothetical protein